MAVSITDGFDLRNGAAAAMLALERTQYTVLEQSAVVLRRPRALKATQPLIERTAGSAVYISLSIRFNPAAPSVARYQENRRGA